MATASPESPHSINKRPKDDVSDDEKDDEKSQKTMAMVRCRILGPVDDTLKLQHGPVPIIKNATDVLIQVLFASINPIDWKISTGKMGPLNPLKPPFNAGSDFSGRVVAKGKDAGDNVAVGDLVYGQSWTIDGSFAEFCICRGSDVRKAPESMSALEASAMPMVSQTSYQALLTAKLQKGQKLLILGGTTSTGMAAIQIAKCAPFEAAEIIVTSSREELCKELGADRVINYKNETWTESLRDYGVDCIYDCVRAGFVGSVPERGSSEEGRSLCDDCGRREGRQTEYVRHDVGDGSEHRESKVLGRSRRCKVRFNCMRSDEEFGRYYKVNRRRSTEGEVRSRLAVRIRGLARNVHQIDGGQSTR